MNHTTNPFYDLCDILFIRQFQKNVNDKTQLNLIAFAVSLSASLFSIVLGMEVEEESQKRSIKPRVKTPSPNPRASRPEQLLSEHPTGQPEAENKLHNLTIRHQPLPPRPRSHSA